MWIFITTKSNVFIHWCTSLPHTLLSSAPWFISYYSSNCSDFSMSLLSWWLHILEMPNSIEVVWCSFLALISSCYNWFLKFSPPTKCSRLPLKIKPPTFQLTHVYTPVGPTFIVGKSLVRRLKYNCLLTASSGITNWLAPNYWLWWNIGGWH